MRKILVAIFIALLALAGITSILKNKEKRVIRVLEQTVKIINDVQWQPAPPGPKETTQLLISPQGKITVTDDNVDAKLKLKVSLVPHLFLKDPIGSQATPSTQAS